MCAQALLAGGLWSRDRLCCALGKGSAFLLVSHGAVSPQQVPYPCDRWSHGLLSLGPTHLHLGLVWGRTIALSTVKGWICRVFLCLVLTLFISWLFSPGRLQRWHKMATACTGQRLDLQKSRIPSGFVELTLTLLRLRSGGFCWCRAAAVGCSCSSLSWLLGLSLSKLYPGVPQQKLAAPGQELLSEYFKVGQAGSCFVRFISKDFQCLQWEAIFVLSRGYLLL